MMFVSLCVAVSVFSHITEGRKSHPISVSLLDVACTQPGDSTCAALENWQSLCKVYKRTAVKAYNQSGNFRVKQNTTKKLKIKNNKDNKLRVKTGKGRKEPGMKHPKFKKSQLKNPKGKDLPLKYHKEKKTWKEALEVCEAQKGTLAMPKTKDAQTNVKEFLQSKVNPHGGFLKNIFILAEAWIGLKDLHNNDTFMWIDGTLLSDTDWLDEQPNHIDENRQENCGAVHLSSTVQGWNDRPCDQTHYFLCQQLNS